MVSEGLLALLNMKSECIRHNVQTHPQAALARKLICGEVQIFDFPGSVFWGKAFITSTLLKAILWKCRLERASIFLSSLQDIDSLGLSWKGFQGIVNLKALFYEVSCITAIDPFCLLCCHSQPEDCHS